MITSKRKNVVIEALEQRVFLHAQPLAAQSDYLTATKSDPQYLIAGYVQAVFSNKVAKPEPGMVVYEDSNGNGVLDSGEPSAATDLNGNYSFSVAAGRVTLRVQEPAGQKLKGHYKDVIALNISNGKVPKVPTLYGISTAPLTVQGNLVDDYYDADGTKEEIGLDNRTIFVDLNQNGILDSDEPSTVTDQKGDFGFSLPQGTYTFRTVQPVGWGASAAHPDYVTLSIPTRLVESDSQPYQSIDYLPALYSSPTNLQVIDVAAFGTPDLMTPSYPFVDFEHSYVNIQNAFGEANKELIEAGAGTILRLVAVRSFGEAGSDYGLEDFKQSPDVQWLSRALPSDMYFLFQDPSEVPVDGAWYSKDSSGGSSAAYAILDGVGGDSIVGTLKSLLGIEESNTTGETEMLNQNAATVAQFQPPVQLPVNSVRNFSETVFIDQSSGPTLRLFGVVKSNVAAGGTVKTGGIIWGPNFGYDGSSFVDYYLSSTDGSPSDAIRLKRVTYYSRDAFAYGLKGGVSTVAPDLHDTLKLPKSLSPGTYYLRASMNGAPPSDDNTVTITVSAGREKKSRS